MLTPDCTFIHFWTKILNIDHSGTDVRPWAKKVQWKFVAPLLPWRYFPFICFSPRYVSRVVKYNKKSFQYLTTFFMSAWGGDSKNMEEIEFSRWFFEGRLRQGKNRLPYGMSWLCYFSGSSKSHRENSTSIVLLESPHQVDMKNVVKCWKDFLLYFTTLEPYSDRSS